MVYPATGAIGGAALGIGTATLLERFLNARQPREQRENTEVENTKRTKWNAVTAAGATAGGVAGLALSPRFKKWMSKKLLEFAPRQLLRI